MSNIPKTVAEKAAFFDAALRDLDPRIGGEPVTPERIMSAWSRDFEMVGVDWRARLEQPDGYYVRNFGFGWGFETTTADAAEHDPSWGRADAIAAAWEHHDKQKAGSQVLHDSDNSQPSRSQIWATLYVDANTAREDSPPPAATEVQIVPCGKCPECDGQGYWDGIISRHVCNACGGAG